MTDEPTTPPAGGHAKLLVPPAAGPWDKPRPPLTHQVSTHHLDAALNLRQIDAALTDTSRQALYAFCRLIDAEPEQAQAAVVAYFAGSAVLDA